MKVERVLQPYITHQPVVSRYLRASNQGFGSCGYKKGALGLRTTSSISEGPCKNSAALAQ